MDKLNFDALEALSQPLQGAESKEKENLQVNGENAAEGVVEGAEAKRYALLEQQAGTARQERALWQRQADNILRSEAARTRLLKGIARGEDPCALLLEALACISLMTGDTLLLEQGRADLLAIYGEGLLRPVPLQMQLDQVRDRLARLKAARPADPDSAARIQRAVEAHQSRLQALQSLQTDTEYTHNTEYVDKIRLR